MVRRRIIKIYRPLAAVCAAAVFVGGNVHLCCGTG